MQIKDTVVAYAGVRVNIGNSPPIKQCARQMPPVHRKEAQQLLQDMLNNDIIQPSSSPGHPPLSLSGRKMDH